MLDPRSRRSEGRDGCGCGARHRSEGATWTYGRPAAAPHPLPAAGPALLPRTLILLPFPPPTACRSMVELDGLCSLRLRKPCEWEGALWEAVGPVQTVPVLSGALGIGAGWGVAAAQAAGAWGEASNGRRACQPARSPPANRMARASCCHERACQHGATCRGSRGVSRRRSSQQPRHHHCPALSPLQCCPPTRRRLQRSWFRRCWTRPTTCASHPRRPCRCRRRRRPVTSTSQRSRRPLRGRRLPSPVGRRRLRACHCFPACMPMGAARGCSAARTGEPIVRASCDPTLLPLPPCLPRRRRQRGWPGRRPCRRPLLPRPAPCPRGSPRRHRRPRPLPRPVPRRHNSPWRTSGSPRRRAAPHRRRPLRRAHLPRPRRPAPPRPLALAAPRRRPRRRPLSRRRQLPHHRCLPLARQAGPLAQPESLPISRPAGRRPTQPGGLPLPRLGGRRALPQPGSLPVSRPLWGAVTRPGGPWPLTWGLWHRRGAVGSAARRSAHAVAVCARRRHHHAAARAAAHLHPAASGCWRRRHDNHWAAADGPGRAAARRRRRRRHRARAAAGGEAAGVWCLLAPLPVRLPTGRPRAA